MAMSMAILGPPSSWQACVILVVVIKPSHLSYHPEGRSTTSTGYSVMAMGHDADAGFIGGDTQ